MFELPLVGLVLFVKHIATFTIHVEILSDATDLPGFESCSNF